MTEASLTDPGDTEARYILRGMLSDWSRLTRAQQDREAAAARARAAAAERRWLDDDGLAGAGVRVR